MPRIFLSHSSADGRAATALRQWLAGRDPSLKRQIFLDSDAYTGMVGGEEWEATLRRNLASCQALLCLISKNWESSKECHYEYKDADGRGKTIFCARLEPDAGLGLISRFQRRELYVDDGQPTTAIDLNDGQPPVVFSTDGLERLLSDVRSPHPGADSFTWPPPDDIQRAPYRGWLPYDSRDAAVFFGRDTELVGALKAFDDVRTAGRRRLFVILGPSGTGKSSFLRAGILPRLDLQRDRFTVLDIIRPGRGEALTGDSGLAKAIVETRNRLGLNTPSLGEVKAQWITVAAKVRALLVECQQRAAELSNDPTAAPTLVIPLDQAEELFSAEAGQEAITLLGLIRDLLAAPDDASAPPTLRVVVAATIRTDRYEAMQTAEELSGVDTVLFNDLKPMRPERFRQVIEGPARRSTEGGRPLSIDSRLVDRLLDDAADHITEGGDTLPLLSGTLSRLFADYGDTGELTTQQYEQIGGISGVVETEINKILSADPAVRADELAKLREAFIPWLATVSANDQPMRRIALWTDLPESGRGLIEKLVDARILIRDTRDLGDSATAGHTVVEIALESFLRQWHELAGWLAEQAEDLKAADVLLRDADRWKANRRDPIYLYPGPLLGQAEKLAATPTFGRKLEPTREFLVASRQLVSQEQREKETTLRRNSMRLALVLAVTVAVAIAAVVAFFSASHSKHVAQTNALDATAQKLRSEATAMLAGTGQGDDVRAIQELLAAHMLAARPSDEPLLDALVKRSSTDLISNGNAPVIGVASADGGHRLAVADSDNLRVWDTGSPTWHSDLRGSARILPVASKTLTSLAISADGRTLAAGSDDGTVQVWNLDDPRPGPRALARPHQGRVTAVALSRDGHRLASAGTDGVIDLSTPEGTDMRSITTRGELFTVAFDPAGDRLAAGGSDGTIRVWRTAVLPPAGDVPPQTTVPNAHPGGVMSITFSPAGNLVATGGADTMVRLWTGDTLSPLPALTTLTGEGHTAAVTSVAFNADGTRLVSGSDDKTVQLWDVTSRQRIGDPLVGHQGLVLSVAFVAGGNEIVSGGNDHALRFWNGVVGQPLSQPLVGHQGPVTSVAISPDGHQIASAGVDGTVRLWNADTGAPIRTMPGPRGGVMTRVAFSRSGDMVASGSFDGTIRLWQLTSDTVRELPTGQPVTAIALSRDGDRLASAGIDGQITIRELASGQATAYENKDHAVVFDVAFDALGDRLASGGVAGILRVWDRTGRQVWQSDVVRQLPTAFRADAGIAEGHPGAVLSVAFSPDGQRLASASVDTTAKTAAGVIQRWDANAGNPLGEPTLLGNAVMGLALSPQTADSPGDRIVAGSFDPYIVQLWNAGPTNGDRLTLAGHEAQVVSVAISADGGRIVSGSVDGTVRIWPNPPAIPLSTALCDKLTTTISRRNWAEWISNTSPYQDVCPGLPPTPDPSPG